MNETVLGISAFYHDSAAALVREGEVLSAAQEERFTRIKHDKSFPVNAIRYCLESTDTDINDLNAIVFYEKPILKFERLIESYYIHSPEGLSSFIPAITSWIKEKSFIKKNIITGLREIDDIESLKIRKKLLFSEHHLSHAASAFYPSPYNDAAILTMDGVGEWATVSISSGKDNKITMLKELKYPHSPGLLYSAFTYYLGFRVNSGEYKLMGLSPYGNAESKRLKVYKQKIYDYLVDLKADGSFFLNQEYFNYSTGLSMIHNKKWEQLFGLSKREPETEITLEHCDMALAIQQVLEDIVIKLAQTSKNLTGCSNLCMAGGVALNCVANSKIINENIFKNVWVQPASGDAGGALGAAFAVYYMYYGNERKVSTDYDAMRGSFLGPQYSPSEVEVSLIKYKPVYQSYENLDELSNTVAELIAKGNIIGWYQGKMEWGPRALGNRSIIADPRNPEMQKRLNLNIKYRESFRPFAPSVLLEDLSQWFKTNIPSPYMLFVSEVNDKIKVQVPYDYYDLPMKDRLYFLRSAVPAITHIDYSARIQTVDKNTNPLYWKLLNAFKKETGCGMVINTSFNVRGEPIVCTPEDAYRCFMNTEIDYLVVDRFMFDKKLQPVWKDKMSYKYDTILD
jgi:carbamoyltransferase